MVTTAKWATPAAIADAITTGLNTLGNGNTALSSAYDNESNLYLYADLELYLASVDLSAQTSLYISVWFLTKMDGSNYEDGSAGTPGTIPARSPDAIFKLRAYNGTQRVNIPNIPFPPFPVEFLLQNSAGAALAASGNTLRYRLHNEQGV